MIYIDNAQRGQKILYSFFQWYLLRSLMVGGGLFEDEKSICVYSVRNFTKKNC